MVEDWDWGFLPFVGRNKLLSCFEIACELPNFSMNENNLRKCLLKSATKEPFKFRPLGFHHSVFL